jgi:hypothetical protein
MPIRHLEHLPQDHRDTAEFVSRRRAMGVVAAVTKPVWVSRATFTHCATVLRFITAALSGERHTLN